MLDGVEGVRTAGNQAAVTPKVRGTESGSGLQRGGSEQERQPGAVERDAMGRKVDRRTLEVAVDNLKQTARIFNKGLDFSIHEETNRIIVRVIDKETHEVIREIPPEKILDIVAQMDKLLGLIIDERA